MCLLKTCVVAIAIGMQSSFKISSTSESLSVSFRKCFMGLSRVQKMRRMCISLAWPTSESQQRNVTLNQEDSKNLVCVFSLKLIEFYSELIQDSSEMCHRKSNRAKGQSVLGKTTALTLSIHLCKSICPKSTSRRGKGTPGSVGTQGLLHCTASSEVIW